jgi:hypothetical protein
MDSIVAVNLLCLKWCFDIRDSVCCYKHCVMENNKPNIKILIIQSNIKPTF